MALERKVYKLLGGIEDLTLGNSTENQTRNGTVYSITQIGGTTLPYDAKTGATIKAKIDEAKAAADTGIANAATAQAQADANVTTLATKVAKTSDTGSALMPIGTTAQRDVTPAEGYTRINLDTNVLEVYVGSAWVTFGTVVELATNTTTHNITADDDYELTSNQNTFARLIITDTGVILTTSRNIKLNTVQRAIFVQNDTLQSLVYKTVSGTGITIPAGEKRLLNNDGTNILIPSLPLTNEIVTVMIANSNITTAKIESAERMTTTNVLAKTAAGAVGAIGTYAFLLTPAGSSYPPGTTLAGSTLKYAGVDVAGGVESTTPAPAGTWRLMGYVTPTDASVFLRIS